MMRRRLACGVTGSALLVEMRLMSSSSSVSWGVLLSSLLSSLSSSLSSSEACENGTSWSAAA
eukprot:10498876-Prorocentrum_lima.AAC.1